jgi:hypothetical protein
VYHQVGFLVRVVRREICSKPSFWLLVVSWQYLTFLGLWRHDFNLHMTFSLFLYITKFSLFIRVSAIGFRLNLMISLHHLQRPYFQIGPHSQVLGGRTSMSLGDTTQTVTPGDPDQRITSLYLCTVGPCKSTLGSSLLFLGELPTQKNLLFSFSGYL